MSELMNTPNNFHSLRERLLTTASAVALLLVVSGTSRADAADTFLSSSDHPPVWFEFGAQLDQIGGGLDPFVPSFAQAPGSVTGGSTAAITQKAPIFAYGGEGKLSYEPNGTDWTFSLGVRYGRALRHALSHSQTAGHKYPPVGRFYDAGSTTNESHFVLDFQAGKDVGLGMFGTHANSIISAGIRIAQFTARSSGFISSAPTINDHYFYKAKPHIDRSTLAVGPSIAWDATVPVIGLPHDGFSLDWGADAAILFGKQKTDFSAQSIRAHHVSGYPPALAYTTSTAASTRRKTVTIPNVGGFVGFSYRLPAAKVSIGYRADMYFGAVDAGAAVRRSSDQSFYGPFLTVGVGIGG